MRQPQCAQVGASAWVAHSKLSKMRAGPPPTEIERGLSYSLPQTSHRAMIILQRCARKLACVLRNMAVMRDIPVAQWSEFLEQFSREHRAWLASVERVHPAAPRR